MYIVDFIQSQIGPVSILNTDFIHIPTWVVVALSELTLNELITWYGIILALSVGTYGLLASYYTQQWMSFSSLAHSLYFVCTDESDATNNTNDYWTEWLSSLIDDIQSMTCKFGFIHAYKLVINTPIWLVLLFPFIALIAVEYKSGTCIDIFALLCIASLLSGSSSIASILFAETYNNCFNRDAGLLEIYSNSIEIKTEGRRMIMMPDVSESKHAKTWFPGYTVLLFAVMTLVATLAFGYPITASLGPGTSGLVTVIITTIIMVVGIRVANTSWGPFAIVTIFSIGAIPFPFFGPPGWHKVILGAFVGLIYIFSVWPRISARRVEVWRMVFVASIATCSSLWIMYGLMLWFALPGAEKLQAFVAVGSIIYGLLGGLGAWLGEIVYARYLKNLSSTRQLQN